MKRIKMLYLAIKANVLYFRYKRRVKQLKSQYGKDFTAYITSEGRVVFVTQRYADTHEEFKDYYAVCWTGCVDFYESIRRGMFIRHYIGKELLKHMNYEITKGKMEGGNAVSIIRSKQ